MVGILMVVFFIIPLYVTILFVVSLIEYLRAKAETKKNPGSFSKEEISLRRKSLIANAVVLGCIVAVIVGLGFLLMNAVAYM